MPNSSFLLDSEEAIESLLAGLDDAATTGWRPYRIIFRNFWFFQRDEFIWHGGRLFLGGQNASGKSTVLSMAVPFLLDGNKSEERLNTFGGHGRNMAYYVTGSANGDDGSEAAYSYHARTSYLALEFRRRTVAGDYEYFTFGQGLQHDRAAEDRTVRSWGFMINDGRRIGRGQPGAPFDLLRDNLTVPSRGELKRLLGAGGAVFDTNADYRQAVNRHIFGFADPDDYDALIELLLQIRRPKLTKEAKPRDVVRILSDSLPPLDSAKMQTTAQSLDNIDQTTQNIERLRLQAAAARELEKRVQLVFRKAAEVAAAEFRTAARVSDADEKAFDDKHSEFRVAQEALEQAEEQLAVCRRDLTGLHAELNQLEADNADALAALKGIEETRQALAVREAEARQVAARIEQHEREQVRVKHQLDELSASWDVERANALAFFDEADAAADEARWATAGRWSEHGRELCARMKPGGERETRAAFPFATVRVEVEDRLARLGQLLKLAEASEQARARWEQCRGHEEQAQQRVFESDAAATEAARAAEAAREAAIEAVGAWIDCFPAPLAADATRMAVLAHLRDCAADAAGPGHVAQPLRASIEHARQAAMAATARASERLKAAEGTLADLEAELAAISARLPEPARTPAQAEARQALSAAGIAWAPLYETLDTAGAQLDTADVEQALADMGLLDALVVAPADRLAALEALHRRGLSERLVLSPGPEVDQQRGAGGSWHGLIPDAQHPLAATAFGALRMIVGDRLSEPAALAADATWRHGLLTGRVAPGATVRFIGRAVRERYQRAEQERLTAECAVAEADCAAYREALTEAQRLGEAIVAAARQLDELPELAVLPTALARSEQANAAAASERERAATASRATQAALAAVDQAEAELIKACDILPAARGLSGNGLRQMAKASEAIGEVFADVDERLRLLARIGDNIASVTERLRVEAEALADQRARADAVANEQRDLDGRLAALERVSGATDTEDLVAHVAALRAAIKQRSADEREYDIQRAIQADAVRRIEQELPVLDDRARASAQGESVARALLAEAVQAYPSLAQYQFSPSAAGRAREVADSLLSRFGDRPGLAQEIRNGETEARAELSQAFDTHRTVLQPYHPELHAAERSARLIQFTIDGVLQLPADLVLHLEKSEMELRDVLREHEAELFERHLIRTVGDEIRRCLLRAQDWVSDINRMLAEHPLRNDERIELRWEPKRSDQEAGGILARHINLIRLTPANLTPEQRDLLMSAFREEIAIVRNQAKRDEWRPDEFREELTKVLDYRNWFDFRLFVSGGVGGRQEITDTYHNARSGSERSLVLLMPLLAALVVRYEAARKDAPRLAALDEAFAGIDPVNSQQLLDFLAALDITWIATSEKMPSLSGAVRGASLYTMLRHGTTVASRCFFWDGAQIIDPEQQPARREAAAADNRGETP